MITALTVLGAFTLVNTWNDIDARTRIIVDKYERDAKVEIERNAEERQRAINETGEKMIAMGNTMTTSLKRRNIPTTIPLVALFVAFVGWSLWLFTHPRKTD